jgi:hypothetical protein
MTANTAPASGGQQNSVENNGRESPLASESPFVSPRSGRNGNMFSGRYWVEDTKSNDKRVKFEYEKKLGLSN